MIDKTYGELFLDLGISYHPPHQPEPLVGLWRLPKVETSYQMMGMRKGNTYHACTLEDFGGKQAEMKQERLKRVHLCFRSTYNLYFEVVRQPGQTQYLCSDDNGIKVDDKFLESTDRWKSLIHATQPNSYGVRDEVRGSGQAIVELLQMVTEKVMSSTLVPV